MEKITRLLADFERHMLSYSETPASIDITTTPEYKQLRRERKEVVAKIRILLTEEDQEV